MNWELSGSQEPTRAAVWITASQPSQALMRAGASWISQLAISTSGGSSLVTLFARTVTRTVWPECTNAEHNLPPKKPVAPVNNTLISVSVWTPCVSESEGERQNRERIPAAPLTRRKTEHSTLKPVPWSDWGQAADQNLDRHGSITWEEGQHEAAPTSAPIRSFVHFSLVAKSVWKNQAPPPSHLPT